MAGAKTEPNYASPKNMLSRWFALLSGTLATMASACIGNLVAGPNADLDVKGALNYTLTMLAVFSVLAAFFFQHKTALNAAAKDETKDGIMDLTPSEMLDLTVNEGIANLTSAMASVLAGLWFGLLPNMHGTTETLEILFAGCVILVIGEFIQLSLQKGSMGEYIVSLLNGMNCGSVSWWVGNATANYFQNEFGCPNGQNGCTQYWMFFATLLVAALNLELINFVSSKVPQKGDSKPYGNFIFSMLKGYPMYTAGLILNNTAMFKDSETYRTSTLTWLCLSAVVIVFFDQLVHSPFYKSLATCGREAKAVEVIVSEVVTLLGQILAFVVGSLATAAMGDRFPSASFGFWCGLACFYQVLSFLIQGARTTCIPATFKDAASAREPAEYHIMVGA